jgi:hypothetical protein
METACSLLFNVSFSSDEEMEDFLCYLKQFKPRKGDTIQIESNFHFGHIMEIVDPSDEEEVKSKMVKLTEIASTKDCDGSLNIVGQLEIE